MSKVYQKVAIGSAGTLGISIGVGSCLTSLIDDPIILVSIFGGGFITSAIGCFGLCSYKPTYKTRK